MADQNAPTATDLNATVQASSFDLSSAFNSTQVDAPATPPPQPPAQAPPAPAKPDLISTLPGNTPVPTSDFRHSETAPTSAPTSASLQMPPNVVPTSESLSPPPAPTSMHLPPPPVYAPEPTPTQQAASYPQQAAAPPKRKSKLPLILGGLAVLLILGVAGLAALYIFVIKPRMEAANQPTKPVVVANTNENTNTNTSRVNANTNESANSNTSGGENVQVGGGSFEAPPNSKQFVNSNAKLNGKLAEHYIDFSFYYPNNWTLDPTAGVPGASNFVGVGRKMPPNLLQENLTVGWYESKGTVEADRASIDNLIQSYSNKLSQSLPGYEKVSQGETKINSMDGYEFHFKGHGEMVGRGDADYWGRVIFLPTGKEGEKNGVTLLMLTTSLAPELKGVDDVGVKGQLPVILSTFKFGK